MYSSGEEEYVIFENIKFLVNAIKNKYNDAVSEASTDMATASSAIVVKIVIVKLIKRKQISFI